MKKIRRKKEESENEKKKKKKRPPTQALDRNGKKIISWSKNYWYSDHHFSWRTDYDILLLLLLLSLL